MSHKASTNRPQAYVNQHKYRPDTRLERWLDRLKGLLARQMLRGLSCLSLRNLQRLGAALGELAWRMNSNSCRVSRNNLALCRPDLTPAEREQWVRDSLRESGKTLLEMAALWCWPAARCLAMIRKVEGLDLLESAEGKPSGLMLLAPHLGNWELAGLFFASRSHMVSLYRPAKVAALDVFIRQARSRTGAELVPTHAQGVVRLLKVLRQGGVVGILPDQEPPLSAGIFAPFMGVAANSMTLVSRLLSKTQAQVLVTYTRRLPDGQGFELMIRAPAAGIADEDLLTSVTAMNQSVADCIQAQPCQYQWGYKRFKRRPG